MGVTFKAEDVNLECPVALKVIDAERLGAEGQREQFQREARAAARVRHPNVASVHHLGKDQEHFFYAMEYIEGETAEMYVARSGSMPLDLALSVASQVACALEVAAQHGLVHGDIKPANIMIAEGIDGLVAKVIDFGLVRAMAGSTDFGGFHGTPQFASPEQAEEVPLDGRSDIYSLGCTLWFLLVGNAPFTGSVANIFAQHLEGTLPMDQLEGQPVAVRTLLARMLQKDPNARPKDATDLRREIERCRSSLNRATIGALHPKRSVSLLRRGAMLSGIPLLAVAVLAVNKAEPDRKLAFAPSPVISAVRAERASGEDKAAIAALWSLEPIGELRSGPDPLDEVNPADPIAAEQDSAAWLAEDGIQLSASRAVSSSGFFVARHDPRSFIQPVSLMAKVPDEIESQSDGGDGPRGTVREKVERRPKNGARNRSNSGHGRRGAEFDPITSMKNVHRSVTGFLHRVF